MTGKDIINFDKVSPSSAVAPSATSSSSSNSANPTDSSNHLSELTKSLEPTINSLSDSLDDGLGTAIDQVMNGLTDKAIVKGLYILYLDRVCERKEESENVGGATEKCLRYPDAVAGTLPPCSTTNYGARFTDLGPELRQRVSRVQSSLVVGEYAISMPRIIELSRSVGSLIEALSTIQSALVAFLIISLIGSGLTILLAIPSLIFRASRLLIFVNILAAYLSSLFAFVAGLLLTVVVLGATSLTGNLGYALGLSIERNFRVLSFVWISCGLMLVVGVYWGVVWFVEVRRWSFVRRLRTDEEVGNWRGMKREIWRDIRREKKQ